MSGITSDIGRFGIVPEWLLLDEAATPQAIRLFAIIGARYIDRETGEAFPSRQTLATDLGVSADTIDRALDSLEITGALTITPRFDAAGDRTSNAYKLAYVRTGSRTDAGTVGGMDAGTGSRTYAAVSRSGSDPESDDPDEREMISQNALRIYSMIASELGLHNVRAGWAEHWLEECTPETVIKAIGIAKERGARSTAYVDRILEEPTFTAAKSPSSGRAVATKGYNRPQTEWVGDGITLSFEESNALIEADNKRRGRA